MCRWECRQILSTSSPECSRSTSFLYILLKFIRFRLFTKNFVEKKMCYRTSYSHCSNSSRFSLKHYGIFLFSCSLLFNYENVILFKKRLSDFFSSTIYWIKIQNFSHSSEKYVTFFGLPSKWARCDGGRGRWTIWKKV